MRRRTLLATAGALLAGGCVDRAGPAYRTGTQRTDTPTTGEPATVDTRGAIGYWFGDDSYTVEAPENDLFAFVTPTGYTGSAPVDAFSLELGGETFAPLGVPGLGVDMPGVDSVYGEDGVGPVLFDLPTVTAESGALVGDGVRYPLSAASLEAFETAPAFTVKSVSVPGTVETGVRVPVSLTVTNEGDGAGRFFAAVRWAFEVRGFVEGVVPAGETVTLSGTFDHDGSTGTRYGAVHYPGGETTIELTVSEPVDG